MSDGEKVQQRGQEPQAKDCKQLFFVQHRVNITLKLMGK